MRFFIGQKYVSNHNPNHFAQVVQLDDEGRAAFVELRNASDELLKDNSRVVHNQFITNWSFVSI